MNIQPIHSNYMEPKRSSDLAGGYDIFMPYAGMIKEGNSNAQKFPLGFAAQVPEGYVAMLLPRSGAGAKYGLELNNTAGIIDADYTGEWIATLRTKDGQAFGWASGERVIQFILVPVLAVEFNTVEQLVKTSRGAGGFGSTGK